MRRGACRRRNGTLGSAGGGWLSLICAAVILVAIIVFAAQSPSDSSRSGNAPDTDAPAARPTRSRVADTARRLPETPTVTGTAALGATALWDTALWDVGGAPQDRLDRVAQLAGKSTDDAALASLVEAARADPAPEVREAALEALESSDSLVALSAFVSGLSDSEEWVREAAAMGIYRFPERLHATGALAGVCRTEDRELRVRAAELLDEMVDLQLPWDEIDGGPVVLGWAPPDPLEEVR